MWAYPACKLNPGDLVEVHADLSIHRSLQGKIGVYVENVPVVYFASARQCRVLIDEKFFLLYEDQIRSI
jgi:hypothetical protein